MNFLLRTEAKLSRVDIDLTPSDLTDLIAGKTLEARLVQQMGQNVVVTVSNEGARSSNQTVRRTAMAMWSDKQALRSGVELGYKYCEAGMSLQQALAKAEVAISGKKEVVKDGSNSGSRATEVQDKGSVGQGKVRRRRVS